MCCFVYVCLTLSNWLLSFSYLFLFFLTLYTLALWRVFSLLLFFYFLVLSLWLTTISKLFCFFLQQTEACWQYNCCLMKFLWCVFLIWAVVWIVSTTINKHLGWVFGKQDYKLLVILLYSQWSCTAGIRRLLIKYQAL